MGGRAEEEQTTHGLFLILGMEWYFPATTVSELCCTIIESPKELTNIALTSGILRKPNKSM